MGYPSSNISLNILHHILYIYKLYLFMSKTTVVLRVMIYTKESHPKDYTIWTLSSSDRRDWLN